MSLIETHCCVRPESVRIQKACAISVFMDQTRIRKDWPELIIPSAFWIGAEYERPIMWVPENFGDDYMK
jgi:hypothetical protein